MLKSCVLLASFCFATAVAAQDNFTFTRTELRRSDVSGAPGMEAILSISELEPGDEVPAHFHNGMEMGYVLEGGMIQTPGQAPSALASGAPVMNLRDVMHAGYTVVGDQTIKLLTVHIVDKGKALYDGTATPAPATSTETKQ